jgi:glycosyltransferase involved in cell wall biosynthesis
MKILLTTNNIGEIWTYALELAKALGEETISVAMATMGWPLTPEQHWEAEGIDNLEVFESHYKPEWMENPWEDVDRAGEWLLRLRDELNPDIIHLNSYAYGDLDWNLPVLITGHSDALSRWQAIHKESPPSSFDHYRAKVRQGLLSAQELVTPTRALLELLEDHYGPLDKGKVIPNGRDPALFRPRRKEPFILARGRLWDQAKNIGVLEKVASKISWPICIVGEHQPPGAVRARRPTLELLGKLSSAQWADSLGRASIYVLPARYEPFGLSALEAGLAGCALVLGDLPSLREVWGDAALFVPPDDAEALNSTFNRLIEDEEICHLYADRAYLRALEYTPEQMATAYIDLYRNLLRQYAETRAETVEMS